MTQDACGLAQLLRVQQLTAGVDDLGAAFAFGLRLSGHGPLHRLRNLDVFDFDHPNLDSPWHGLVGDGLAEVVVEVFAVCQPRVKIHSSQQGPQRGWRD